MNRQRDERLDRTAASRRVTIGNALANYENALQHPAGRRRPRQPGRPGPLEQAGDSGRTTVSNQTTLPGDHDLPPGRRPVAFELFVPVYRVELQPDASVAERRRGFLGWATGQLRAGDFLDAAMRAAPPFTGVSCTTSPCRATRS